MPANFTLNTDVQLLYIATLVGAGTSIEAYLAYLVDIPGKGHGGDGRTDK